MMKAPLWVNVCLEVTGWSPTSFFFKYHWNFHILIIKKHVPYWQSIIPSSVSDRVKVVVQHEHSGADFRERKSYVSICFRSLCCWRHLGEKGHTQTSSGQDEGNQFQAPKAQTRSVNQSLLPFGFLAV